MSVEMTVAPEMHVTEGSQQPPEEPPKQEAAPQNAAPKKTWTCSQCGKEFDWLPPQVRHLKPEIICCKNCHTAKKASKAPAEAPASPPAPAREAPARPAPQQRRPAGGPHRAQAPRVLTLEIVEACALRVGIDPPQVDSLLACIRSRLTPSSDK